VPLFRRRPRRGTVRTADTGDADHLKAFARDHTGVEAFVEPPTAVSTTTVVFVASTGEWTRRRVRDARAAHELANKLAIPSYDAAVVGYPQRMRDWNERKRRSADRPEAAGPDEAPA
jgi:transcriptional regulator of met regulon